jgi:hypothetical protein
MRGNTHARRWAALGAAVTLGLSTGSGAEPTAPPTATELAQQDRILELERKVEVLTEELAKIRVETAVPEDTTAPLESYGGMAPAASKIYGIARGLSLGGYAEGNFRAFPDGDGTDTSDLLRLVVYSGYKFTEKLMFNSEIEFEHATTEENPSGEEGSVSVEFAALDYLWKDPLNLRGGLLLVPMGFLNEVHEPPFFYGVLRPLVETRIIPTTWSDNGAGIFGRLGENLEYRAYALTALDAQGVRPDSLRDARSNGNQSRAEDWAGVARLDWTPLEGLLLGGSVYSGEIDQGRSGFPDTQLTLYELHAQYRWRGLALRGLFTQAFIGNAGDLTQTLRNGGAIEPTDTIADTWLGWYVEGAYDLMPWLAPDRGWSMAPFFRYEQVNTQFDVPSGFSANAADDVQVFTPGIQFKPYPNVVLKFDYQNLVPRQGDSTQAVELGFGLAF